MSLSRRHFKIAEILAAFFTGAQTERDEQELEAWQKEKEANKVLAGRLSEKKCMRRIWMLVNVSQRKMRGRMLINGYVKIEKKSGTGGNLSDMQL